MGAEGEVYEGGDAVPCQDVLDLGGIGELGAVLYEGESPEVVGFLGDEVYEALFDPFVVPGEDAADLDAAQAAGGVL